MTLQQKNKLKELHDRWKPYYSLIAILLTFLGLSWEISHAAYSVISSDTRELHEATTVNKQQGLEISQIKADAKTAADFLKEDNQRRDEKINQNTSDISYLYGKN